MYIIYHIYISRLSIRLYYRKLMARGSFFFSPLSFFSFCCASSETSGSGFSAANTAWTTVWISASSSQYSPKSQRQPRSTCGP